MITDLLPAGFEIENPRTKEIPGMDWIKDASTPTALDVRDDRIHFFVDATGSKAGLLLCGAGCVTREL